MSRGLGSVQERALAVLNGREPPTVVELAMMLGLAERRCRKMVAALEERGEVVVVTDERPARVWLSWRREQFLFDQREEERRARDTQEFFEFLRIRYHTKKRIIPCRWCGSDNEVPD